MPINGFCRCYTVISFFGSCFKMGEKGDKGLKLYQAKMQLVSHSVTNQLHFSIAGTF